MRFGVGYQTAAFGMDPDRLVAYARHAEACGFESIYLPEHVALYPGAELGGVALPSTLAIADPLDCLAYVAAATERILLGTAVLLIPYHHPVILAKRLATIDALSKGRMRLLSVGVGSLPGEAAAAGVDFTTRGRRADEAIDALRLLWASDENGVDFAGEFYTLTHACSYPKPYDATTLPIHVGGSTEAAARRAGQRGDGYFPGGMLGPYERARQWELVRKSAVDAGRDPDALEYARWGSIDLTPDRVAGLAQQGVHRIVVNAGGAELSEQLDALSAFAERHGLG